MVEGNMSKFENQIILFLSGGENSCLNACVLLKSCFDVFKTPDPFAEFRFAQGLAKVKLGGVC